MTEINDNVKKPDSQLPSINNKDQNSSINNENSKSQQDGNVFPLTHNKKHKKHKKKFRKHSPQYYQQKRIQKFNRKLEEKWDSHFINDHIPDLYGKKKRPTKLGKTLSKLTSDKRSITPSNPKIVGNTAGTFAVRKDSIPLPKIQKPSKRSNSFNVHVVPQKPIIMTQKAQRASEQANQSKKQIKPPSQQNKKRQKTSQQSRHPATVELQKAKSKAYLQDYKKALSDLHQEVKFTNCHKQVLELFLDVIDRKNVRDLLDKQLNLIRKKQSLVFKVNNAIANRQKLLDRVKQSGLKLLQDDKETLQLIDHYRTSTLAVVEQILKWKETWHALYYEVYKKSKNFDFVYQTQNYLLTIMSSTDALLEEIVKQRIQSKRVEKTDNKHQVKEETNSKKQEKTQKKAESNKQIQAIPDTSSALKQENTVSLAIENSKTLQKQIIVPTTNVEPSKKSVAQQTPIKQLNSDKKQKQSQKPITKPQSQKSTFATTENDPFLISLHSIGKEDKNIILKIRACELLLIEESFNFMKK